MRSVGRGHVEGPGCRPGGARRFAPLRKATAETKIDAHAAPEGLRHRYVICSDLLREGRENKKHLKQEGGSRALGDTARLGSAARPALRPPAEAGRRSPHPAARPREPRPRRAAPRGLR